MWADICFPPPHQIVGRSGVDTTTEFGAFVVTVCTPYVRYHLANREQYTQSGGFRARSRGKGSASVGGMSGWPRLALLALGMRGIGPTDARLRASVAGKLIVVTGASRGIGAATAGRLALAGARVVLLARTRGDLEVLAARIRRRGGEAVVVVVDLRDTEAARAAADEVLAYGIPDVVVSNAGHSIHRDLVDYADRFHDVTRTAGVNYLGPVALLLGLLPPMMERGSGQLVSVSSTSVSIPAPGWSVYGASKSAFEAWLRAVAPELAARGVATTSLRLPLVHTAMSASTYRSSPGLTVRGAAQLVCRAIVDRPRLISPWWVRVGGALADAAPGLTDRLATAYQRRRS